MTKTKKLLLLLMVAVCSTGQALGQSVWDNVERVTQVLVWSSDSTYTVYKCADNPTVYADETGLVLSVNGTQVVFPGNEVRKFTFADEASTGVENAVAKGTYEITQNLVKVDGLVAGTLVAIYDTGGRLVTQSKAVTGNVAIDISSLSHGVYVVKAGSTNFKFMKR